MSLVPYMPYEPTEVPMEVAVLFTTVVTILSILVNSVQQKQKEQPVLLLDAETQTDEQEPPRAPKRARIHSPPKLHASIMSSNPLDEQILSVLATNLKPMTVRDIGKILYRHKHDINKRIYYMKQCKIVGMEGSTRLWALA